MTLIACCILFVCKVSVWLKGRREAMRRMSQRTFKLEQRPERPWAISWLPDLPVSAHDKDQLRSVTAWLLFSFLCLLPYIGRRTQPNNKGVEMTNNRPCLLYCFVTSFNSHDLFFCKTVPFKTGHNYGRSKKCRQRRQSLGGNV